MITAMSVIMIVFGLIGLFGVLYNVSKKADRDLLDDMFNEGDINASTYKKYLKK